MNKATLKNYFFILFSLTFSFEVFALDRADDPVKVRNDGLGNLNYGFFFDALRPLAYFQSNCTTLPCVRIGVNKTSDKAGFNVAFWGLPFLNTNVTTGRSTSLCSQLSNFPQTNSLTAVSSTNVVFAKSSALTKTKAGGSSIWASHQWAPRPYDTCQSEIKDGIQARGGAGESYVMLSPCDVSNITLPCSVQGTGGLGIFTLSGKSLINPAKQSFWQDYQSFGQPLATNLNWPVTPGPNHFDQGVFPSFQFNFREGEEKLIRPFGTYSNASSASKSYMVVKITPEITSAKIPLHTQVHEQSLLTLRRTTVKVGTINDYPSISFKFDIGVAKGSSSSAYGLNYYIPKYARVMFDPGAGSRAVVSFHLPTQAGKNTCLQKNDGTKFSLVKSILGNGTRYGGFKANATSATTSLASVLFPAEDWQFEMTFQEFQNALETVAEKAGVSVESYFGAGYDAPKNWALKGINFSQEVVNKDLLETSYIGGRIKKFEVFNHHWSSVPDMTNRYKCD